MSDPLAEVLRHPALWRGDDAGAFPTVSTGFRPLDARLPGGGWPLATLIEFLVPAAGVGEVRLLLPALRALAARAAEEKPRWIAWLAPPHLPYAPALADAGLDPAHMLVIRPRAGLDVLWAMEQSLRSGACAAVLGWIGEASDQALRRLKLAAEEGRSPAFLFRPSRHRNESSPAALRLALAARDGSLDVEILKSRGGAPARIERLQIR